VNTLTKEKKLMASYNFDIPVDPIALMTMVKDLVQQNGGIVCGQIPNLTVRFPTAVGEVGGSCRLLNPSVVNIEVTKKPDIVPNSVVREKLVFYLTEAVKLYTQQTRAARQQGGQVVL
jgi:hypothetical protein